MKISKELVEQIFVQGQQEAPIEACGYLAGSGDTILKRIRLRNVDASSEHFSFDPAEQFRAVKSVRSEGLVILAVYHTHPQAPARPSAEDIRLAFDPGIIYVIASLVPGKQDIRAFRIVKGSVSNEPVEIVE